MQRHHISNRALAVIIVIAVIVMWLINQPNGRNVPEKALFRGHHAAGSITDNVLMSDFQGLAGQTEPVMPSRALGIFRLTSDKANQSLICLKGNKAAQTALVEELSGCSGVLAVNVDLRFQLLSAALQANNADEAHYQAERLEQAYTILRVTDKKFDQPLKGWGALHDAIKAGNLTQASGLFEQVFRDCAPCQGPDGQRFLKAYGKS